MAGRGSTFWTKSLKTQDQEARRLGQRAQGRSQEEAEPAKSEISLVPQPSGGT